MVSAQTVSNASSGVRATSPVDIEFLCWPTLSNSRCGPAQISAFVIAHFSQQDDTMRAIDFFRHRSRCQYRSKDDHDGRMQRFPQAHYPSKQDLFHSAQHDSTSWLKKYLLTVYADHAEKRHGCGEAQLLSKLHSVR